MSVTHQWAVLLTLPLDKFLSETNVMALRGKSVMTEEVMEIGTIKHFFPKISVAIIELTAPLSVGDHILVKGPATDFDMTVDSMQIEHLSIQSAESGKSIGLKTPKPVKERDVVYKKV
jgi:hypothetical protein